MPSFFHLMVGLGGTALIVGVTLLWLNEPNRLSPLPESLPSSPSKTVGTSALSHGGPSPSSRIASPSTPHVQIGQKAIVLPDTYGSHTVTLLSSPPHSSTLSFPSESTRALSSGTVVLVTGIKVITPASGQTEQYYEVTLPDGGKGWLSEHVLSQAANSD